MTVPDPVKGLWRKRISCGLFALLAWAALGLFLTSSVAQAPVDGVALWRDVAPPVRLGLSHLASYRLVAVDPVRLNALLAQAHHTPVSVPLPLPHGDFAWFEMRPAPVLAPGLAAQFPEIQSYRGQSPSHPHTTARLHRAADGWHAIILSATGAIYLDPLAKGGRTYYLIYAKDALRVSQAWTETLVGAPPETDATAPVTAFGATRHIYRLALAATGEYSQYHGGTITATLSALSTAVSRLNAIYERELAVEFVLIEQTPHLIYLDPETDPYTNGNLPQMAVENQENLDRLLGAAAYDLGHVFGLGQGSGVAWLGNVCDEDDKAKAATVAPAPEDDPFVVDLVAHELGHQFGATHTFNARSGQGCIFGREANTAYEPGSGSTIMSYAGVCGPQDLQPHSDEYFHAANLAQMAAFIDDRGRQCGTHLSSGNHPPTVQAGRAYTIPTRTPFTLGGSATDLDGDPLSYSWEQLDLGAPWLSLDLPNTDADGLPRPILRSYPPALIPFRTLPRWESIFDGSLENSGEALPTMTRTLTFRLTARDGRGGWGSDTVQLAVAGASGPFAVVTPTAGITWPALSHQTVLWDVAGTAGPPVNCTSVDISLSTDGRRQFSTLLAAHTPNDGHELVLVPCTTPTARARVKIACADHIFFAASPADFHITTDHITRTWLPLIRHNAR